MHVAYVCADPGIPVLGSKGASIHVQQIVRAFQRRGDTVTVYCTRTGDGTADALGGARIVTRPVSRGDAASRERDVAAASVELAAHAEADGCDLVYERYTLFSDASARIGAPGIVEVNAPLIEEQRAYRHLVNEGEAIAVTEHVLNRASVVACVSDPVAHWARTHGAPSPIIAANGVDTRAFSPAPDGGDALQVVFVGSLKPWHGVDVAIDALSGLDGVELTILGDGPERASLERQAARRGTAVRWLGALPHARVPEVLSTMHAGLAPYPADAGTYFSPLKVYEYLAAGLAVVASDIGELPAVIEHGVTGMLVLPGDTAELRAAIETLRDDRPLARQLGIAARKQALARHDWDRTLESILAAVDVSAPALAGRGGEVRA